MICPRRGGADEDEPLREREPLREALVDDAGGRVLRERVVVVRVHRPVSRPGEGRVVVQPRVVVVSGEDATACVGVVDHDALRGRRLRDGLALAGEEDHVVGVYLRLGAPERRLARRRGVDPRAGALSSPPAGPSPAKNWIRPVPPGLVNSLSSMPILRKTHSSASTAPVTIAMSGMSPSASPAGQAAFPVWQSGSFVRAAATAVFTQAARSECDLTAPAPELDDERDVGADGHVRQGELAVDAGRRRHERVARHGAARTTRRG